AALAAAVSIAALRVTPQVWGDPGVWLSVAARLLDGDRLYADVFDNKDPFFFYSYALSLRVAGVRGPFALEVVWLAVGTVWPAMALRARCVWWLGRPRRAADGASRTSRRGARGRHGRGRLSACADGVVVRAGCDDGARARNRPARTLAVGSGCRLRRGVPRRRRDAVQAKSRAGGRRSADRPSPRRRRRCQPPTP